MSAKVVHTVVWAHCGCLQTQEDGILLILRKIARMSPVEMNLEARFDAYVAEEKKD